jgi:hypothetical protein
VKTVLMIIGGIVVLAFIFGLLMIWYAYWTAKDE